MKLSHDQIVERLEAHGLVHRTVQMHTEGEYLPTDVDWNNKDVPHLNHLHSLVNDVTCVAEKDLQASISLQKVLGIPFPLILVHYDIGPNHQTHFVTLLAYSMITNHQFIQLSPTRTRAVTTYTVCSTRFWMLFWPLIRRLIKRNWAQLMTEDVPMRTRRGQLRSWGYSFRGDDEPMRDIRASIPIAANNVLLPDPPLEVPAIAPVPVERIPRDGFTYLSREDHLGLALTRDGDRVLAYPRLCPHEGARLDDAPMADGCLVCPWHGRELGPVATLDLREDEPHADTDWHHLEVVDGKLHVSVSEAGTPGEPCVRRRRATTGAD